MDPLKSPLPFVSVVMPVFNEERYIARSLHSVIAQNYPPSLFEIIVADGGSTDATRSIIRKIGAQNLHISLTVLDNPQRIVPTGLNLAIRQAHGDIVIRADGHSTLAPNYIAGCVSHLLQHNADAVGGQLKTIGETAFAKAIALSVSSYFGVGGVSFRVPSTRTECSLTDTLVFAAYKRETLEVGGPFDEEMIRNEDDEYNFRLRKLKKRLLFCPDIHSNYYCQSTLRGLWRQYYLYGIWKVRVMQKHPLQMHLRHFVPAIFVAALAISILTVFTTPMTLGIVALYAGVNLQASFSLSRKYGWPNFIYLPIIFFTLHCSYGLGFWRGLFAFWNKWHRQ